VIEHCLRWSHPEGDVDENARCARPATKAARQVDELADALVARPRQAKSFRITPDPPAGLRDRVRSFVVAYDGLE
jgi:hypothetical protein